jgi:hypothetical protein
MGLRASNLTRRCNNKRLLLIDELESTLESFRKEPSFVDSRLNCANYTLYLRWTYRDVILSPIHKDTD